MSRLKRLIVEIHDRSLWQVLLVYVGGSWAVLEAVAFFRDEYGLPGWLLTVVLVLLVVGLFVVVALSFVPIEAPAAPTPAGVIPPTEVEAGVGQAEAVAARRRVLTWRNAGFTFVGVLAVWGLIAAGWVVVGGTSYLLFRGAAAGFVKPEDCVVVAEFEDETEEPGLGAAVRDAVVADLSQSGYVTVLGFDQLRETLGLMRLPGTTLVDQRLALEIARRDNCPVAVSGNVAPLGTGYSMTAAIIEAETGAALVTLNQAATDETEVVGVVGRLARLVRRHLGESLPSLRRSDPLGKVTTSSLEALILYSRAARRADRRGDQHGAIALLEQAVALDTAFAEAYRKLSAYYNNVGNRAESERNSERAYQLRERLPMIERLKIVADYHALRGRQDSAVHYYRMGFDLYPSTGGFGNNLGYLYMVMGRYEEALQLEHFLVFERGFPVLTVYNLVHTASTLGRHALADSGLEILREKLPPGHGGILQTAAWNAYYAGCCWPTPTLPWDTSTRPSLSTTR